MKGENTSSTAQYNIRFEYLTRLRTLIYMANDSSRLGQRIKICESQTTLSTVV